MMQWYDDGGGNGFLCRYNHIKTNTNDVEFNLIRKEMEDIDGDIHKAEMELTWNSESKIPDVGCCSVFQASYFLRH